MHPCSNESREAGRPRIEPADIVPECADRHGIVPEVDARGAAEVGRNIGE